MTDHPIHPSDDQIREWRLQAPNARDGGATREHWIARTAYAAGADAQLEACCRWIGQYIGSRTANNLREAMRPKPPSLAEQALAILDDSRLDAAHENCIRRALERLAELEGAADG